MKRLVLLLVLLSGCGPAFTAALFDEPDSAVGGAVDADDDESHDDAGDAVTTDSAIVYDADVIDAADATPQPPLNACPQTQEYYQRFQAEMQRDGGGRMSCPVGNECPAEWCCWARNICLPQ